MHSTHTHTFSGNSFFRRTSAEADIGRLCLWLMSLNGIAGDGSKWAVQLALLHSRILDCPLGSRGNGSREWNMELVNTLVEEIVCMKLEISIVSTFAGGVCKSCKLRCHVLEFAGARKILCKTSFEIFCKSNHWTQKIYFHHLHPRCPTSLETWKPRDARLAAEWSECLPPWTFPIQVLTFCAFLSQRMLENYWPKEYFHT